MSRTDEGPQERFEEFLRTYKDEHGTLVYWPKCEQMSLNDETSLRVNFQDLVSFDNMFAVLVTEDPQKFLATASSALLSILRMEDPDYVEKLDVSTIRIRIINYSEHVPLRHIRSKHIGKLIQINGILMRASEVKPLLVEAVFRCRVCGQDIPQTQEEGRYTEPPLCPTCGKKTAMRLIPEQSRFIDWQKVRVQESPDELPPGQMPRSVDVVLEGDIVDVSRPGDLVKLTGLLQTSPDFSRRGGRLATFNVFIEANGVEIAEKEYEQVEISEEDEKRIRELAEDPYVHERIYASIAPSIQGHERVKESIALLLFGGVEKVLSDGTHLRGRSNILMIGDPGTGKSQILKFVAGLASRGLYTSGKGTTAAGLTAAVIHDTDTGAMTLEAGALVLADQGVACLHPSTKVIFNNHIATVESLFDERLKKEATSGSEIVEVSPIKGGIKAFDIDNLDSVDDECTLVRRKRHVGKLIRARLASGFEIRLTPDHKVVDGNSLQWKDIGSCKAGEMILSPLKLRDAVSPIYIFDIIPDDWVVVLKREDKNLLKGRILQHFRSLSEFNRCFGVSRHILSSNQQFKMGKLREILGRLGLVSEWRERLLSYGRKGRGETLRTNQVTPELAYLIGFVYGDGNYTIRRRRSRFCVYQSAKKEDIIRNLDNALHSISYCDFNRYYRTTRSEIRGKQVTSKSVTLYRGSSVLTYLIDYFLADNLANILMLPQECMKAFVSGALDADGCVSVKSGTKSNKEYRTAHIEFLLSNNREKDLTFILALRRLDVYARLKERENVNVIRVTGRKDVQLLCASTKEYSIKARNASIPDNIHEVSSASEKLPSRPVSEICDLISLGSKSELLDKGIWSTVHAYKNQRYQPSRRQLFKIADLMADRLPIPISCEINRLLKRDYFLDEIVSIEEEHFDGWVYDLYVKHHHNFVANGVLMHNCIDEFDKMDPDDRTSIHEAMEQHTVSIAKAGIVATLNARTSILAAANPALGRYEPSLSVQDNIKLPFTILSRFDLIWILVDTIEPTKDRELAQFILNMHQRKKNPTKDSSPPIPPDFLKKYIGFANRYVIPQLTPEAAEVMEDFYVDLRKSAEGGAAPVPITARQLESLVRLAEARARMALRPKVTKEDAQAAVRLMQESLRMVAFDTVTGKIDIDRLVSKMSAAQRSSSDIILKAIKDMEAEGTPVVSEDALLQRVTSMGLPRERAEEVIRKLVSEGILFNPREGKIKRAQV